MDWQLVLASEIFFSGFFCIEMFFRMLAMGLAGDKRGYFMNPFNRLDFILVTASILNQLPWLGFNSGGSSFLRIIRVIRPLAAVKQLPGLKLLVQTLLDAIPALTNVLLLCAIFMVLFSILGIQLWAGLFRQRCSLPTGTNASQAVRSMVKEYLTTTIGNDTFTSRNMTYTDVPQWYYSGTVEAYVCSAHGAGFKQCGPRDDYGTAVEAYGSYTVCSQVGDNLYGLAGGSFDHIGAASLLVFQVCGSLLCGSPSRAALTRPLLLLR